MPQTLIVISRQPLVAGLLLFLALAALAGLARAEAASGAQEPRIVAVEGFAFEPNQGKAPRVAALVLSRHPDIEPRDYPKRYREHLRFRAHVRLDVFDGQERIARGREAESVPVAAKRHSLRFVHLLLFSPAESAAILAAADTPRRLPPGGFGPDGGLEDGEAPETVNTSSVFAFTIEASGDTLERSRVEEEALVGLADQAPPRVIDGCVIVPGKHCSGANLSGADLSGADLSGGLLRRANLSGADLSHANLSGAGLYNANLTGANLSNANLTGARLDGADLTGADLSNANVSGARLGANLTGTNLTGVNLAAADLAGANLSGHDLAGVNLPGVRLDGVNLSRANLSGANLSRTILRGANLSGANLSGADLSDARTWRADFSGANLSYANLSRADFGEGDQPVNFFGVNLFGANIDGTFFGNLRLCNTTWVDGRVSNQHCPR